MLDKISIMSNFNVYGFCLIVSASLVALLSMSTDFFVQWVNDIVIPCQHDSVWTGVSCNCDNTRGVYGGAYCDECQCAHQGICSISSKGGSSRWGCLCPAHKKWTGTLCDSCYAVDHNASLNECSGVCLNSSTHQHFGPKCDTVCVPRGSSGDSVCREVASGGGVCNACNGHGACGPTGTCECDEGWFNTLGGEQCALSCETAGIDCPDDRGICQSIGGELQCVCAPGYYGRDCDLTCKSVNDIPCSGHGTCGLSALGVPACTCDTHYAGDMCQHECPGDKSFPTPCSGHGTCSIVMNDFINKEVAVCSCNKNSLWEGVDCSCNARFSCSGHGTCKHDATCNCNDWTDPSHQHFAGAACQKCKEHWYGRECHLRCDPDSTYVPDEFAKRDQSRDGTDIGCNGFGTCDIIPTGLGERVQCSCRGTDPTWFCARCEANYYPLTSIKTAEAYCTEECNEATCSFRGICNEDYDGTNDICVCDTITVGAVEFDTIDPTQYCSTCKQNWFPDQMTSSAPCTHYCDSEGTIEGRIIVFGEDRELRGDVNAQNVCARNDDGWTADPDCRVCSGKGTCQGDGECECEGGVTGLYCEIDCGTTANGQVCNGHGKCIRNDLDMWFDPFTEEYRCECQPYDTYTSETRQRLLKRGFQVEPPPTPDFYGKYCEFHCPRYNEEVCADRGQCTIGVTTPEKSDVDKGLEAGVPKVCARDDDCKDMPGAFCAQLSSPWDSLMSGTKSFFSSGPQSPGYFNCAASQNCLDSIYSIPWDDYCVNMLNGWYPNVLNTASCTYHVDPVVNCREKIEDFFIQPYGNSNKTWCQSALEQMAPITMVDSNDNADGAMCGPTTHASLDMFNLNEVLCHTWELEAACNSNGQCIYDQTLRYIDATDSKCTSLSIIEGKCCVDENDCPDECRVNTEGTGCETKTYCRARNCEDAIIENNVESLCVSVQAPCDKKDDDYWSSFCTKMTGSLRGLTELTTKETFYSCVMFENSMNPQRVQSDIPGGIDIYGEITIAPEDTSPIAQYRSAFLASRTLLNVNSACGKSLRDIDFTTSGFCDKHLDYVVPTWYEHHTETANWFKEYLVICASGIESVYSTAAKADDRAALLRKECTVQYKCRNRQDPSWDAACEDEDSDLSVPAWTLKCLTSGETEFSELDWSILPEDVSECTLHENTFVTRWGASQWDVNDVISKFTDNCKKGLDASWIPKEVPIPRICDMGACSEGHTCVPCSDETMKCNQGVVCIAPNNVNCFDDMPCQNGGECFQPYFFESSNKYLCEWEHNEPVLAYIGGFEYNAELTSRNLLVVQGISADDITALTIVRNDSWSTLTDPDIFDGDNVRIPWTSSWNNCTHVFCPLTGTCADDCSDCGSANGKICSIQQVGPKAIGAALPPVFEDCTVDNNYNWYAYCANQAMGLDLHTGASNGLHSLWSGNNVLLGDKKLLLKATAATMSGQVKVIIDVEASDPEASLVMVIDGEETIWHLIGDVLPYTDYVRTNRTTASQIEILHRGSADSSIELRALFGANLVLKSVLVDNVEQILSVGDTLDPNRFYLDQEENVTNYRSWSFGADGTASIFRNQNEVHPSTKQCSLETTGTQMSKVCTTDQIPTNGQRWALDDAYEKRIHGWTKIQQTQKKVANMDVYNADFTPIVSLYVYQKRLYVNEEPTECRVEASEWWHWTIDMHATGETHFVTDNEYVVNEFLIVEEGKTLFEQTWDIRVSIGDCDFESTRRLVTTSDERFTHSLAGSHFHHVTATKEHECRAQCHAHEDCRQWSWTAPAEDCYLHSTPCHEGGCTLGSHTMHTFHARGVSYFDVWSASKNTKVSWNHIRAEDIIDAPFSCPVIDTQASIPKKWQTPFEELYIPLEIDATSICNKLHTMWEPLPGYKTGHCSGKDDCVYGANDLTDCANFIEHATPDVAGVSDCDNEKELFSDLDWTSYCRYERSFYNDIVFLGGRDIYTETKTMKAMCEKVASFREDADTHCSAPVDNEWFGNCFDRTLAYEEFCSTECISHIEGMLDEVGDDDPSICSIRKQFLDIGDVGLHENCECSLENIIVTDFCMSQNAYHIGNNVKIPELYNSECSASCTNTLQESMDRATWRTWCQELSEGEIPGMCAKTICECDVDNRGVAGDICELTCPAGIDDGVELACSGRNGRCFAIDEEEIVDDLETQVANGEFRHESFSGPNLPIWKRGPEPTADGRCQCALGSGQSCSIPCDMCNNGTYGQAAASQFGMCDSFNGVCRGLAPWMRYNFDKALKEGLSSNTTGFESGLGVAKWSFPDRFIFESDSTLLEAAMRYIEDPDGLRQADIAEPVLEEEEIMLLIFDVFEDLCWDETATDSDYLSNKKSVTQRGLNMGVGQLDLKTIELPESGLCTSIPYSDDLTICYSNGEFHAMDKTERLIVIEKGNSQITKTGDFTLQGMSFTKHPDGDIYAFGGQWDYGTTQEKMNNLYRIKVRRVTWHPSDIIFLDWSIVPVGGSIPPGQIYTVISSSTNDVYLLSSTAGKYTMHALSLPTPISPVGIWSVIPSVVPEQGVPKNMNFVGMGQFYVHFVGGTWLFTPEAAEPFARQTGTFKSEPLTVLSEKLPKSTKTCQLNLKHDGETTVLEFGLQPVIRANGIYESAYIYISEWISVDTSTRAALTRRFLETVTFDQGMKAVVTSEMTESDKMLAVEMVERIYMHQARWVSSEMMYAKTQLSSTVWPDVNMFQHVPVDTAVFTSAFENVFDSLELAYLSGDVQSSPTYIAVVLEGSEPNRRLSIQGNYAEEKEGYTQTFYIGGHKMEIYIEWSLNMLRVKLSKRGDPGNIRWLLGGEPCRTFVLDIALEDWLRMAVDTREEDSYRNLYSDKDGRRAMFNLFTSREVSHSHSMLKQTSDFLAYSSSHCYVTASEQCPGLLPYINLPCSGRGRCSSACQCVCEVAPSVLQTSDTALQSVETENSPYRGRGCEITCPGFDGYDLESICSGRGNCQYDGSCACPQGYTGDACQFKCPIDDEGKICSARGGCGTRATEMASFVFGKNNYLDSVTAINKKNYIMALSSFYSPCQELNYIRQKGEFRADFNVANGDFASPEVAFSKCEEINLAIRQNARLNRDVEFRDYPYGTCIGVIENLPSYFVATLNKPIRKNMMLGSVEMFNCVPAECTFKASETNDFSIRGLETTLLSPSFEIKMKYIHGVSSGTEHYKVNGQDFYIRTEWTRYKFKVDFYNTNGFENNTFVINDHVSMFTMIVEDGVSMYKVYKDYFPVTTEDSFLFLAPMFEHKYVKMLDELDMFVLVEDMPYLDFEAVEYACDMEPLCTGIVQWDNSFRENLYSLYAEVDNVQGFNSFRMPENSHIFYRKMSMVYQGRETMTSKCDTISGKRAKYPTVEYTVTYDIPIEEIDLTLAKDEDTSAIIVGKGLWTQCWTKAEAASKNECYEKALAAGTYGFAYSDAEEVCLIYHKLTDPTRIKLGRYNSESRLNIFHPCNSENTYWRPIQ